MENQPEELPCEMENLPEEFLKLWREEEEEEEDEEEEEHANFWDKYGNFWTEEQKEEFKRMEDCVDLEFELEKKSEEQVHGNLKQERTAWKRSEMDFFIGISEMLSKKQINIQMKVHQKMLPLKEGREEGVQAHNKLMAYFADHLPAYHKFRSYWEKFKATKFPWMKNNTYITFEDTTRFYPMMYTDGNEGVPRFVYEGSSKSLQIYSVKVARSPVQREKRMKVAGSRTQWSLEVFGVVAVRDCIDPRRNLIFYRDRDNCQIITKENPYLKLTGPTRAVGMNDVVMIEAELKVKGAVESEDNYLIAHGTKVSQVPGHGSVELTSPSEWKLNIAVAGLETCVEATVFIKVINGTWPIGFHGLFAAHTDGINEKIILIEFSAVDHNMEQLRHVVSVEPSGVLIVSGQAWNEEQMISGTTIFKPKMFGRSFHYLKVGSCNFGVLVVWSRIQPACEELEPESQRDLVFGDGAPIHASGP